MLKSCPECSQQVSDKAVSCPHCGLPLISTRTAKRRNPPKRMRLPNGFGQISELKSQNLRKPFRVMVNVGHDENGRPISKLLQPTAYFKTYAEAFEALVAYNKNPFDLTDNPTMTDLFNLWFSEYQDSGFSKNAVGAMKLAWSRAQSIASMPVRSVRVRHLQECIETSDATIICKTNIKKLFNLMFDKAVQLDMTDKNYARLFNLPRKDTHAIEANRKHHIPYTTDEISTLWTLWQTDTCAAVILVQCYAGWRPREISEMPLSAVDLEARTFTYGIKTEAGKNRTVPIHPRILPIVEHYYAIAQTSKYKTLFYGNYKQPFGTFEHYYVPFIAKHNFNPEHKPHDGRVHFVTAAKAANLDEYAIKRIVGHKISDLTESVYTHRSTDWLRSEIEKIK